MAHIGDDIRPVTPALLAGVAAGLREREEVQLDGGHEGSLMLFGEGRSASTVLLTKVRSSIAFVPALVCRDRVATPGRPAELPAERWEETKLESDSFNRRYLLLNLAGQDAGLMRELFSPALISWFETRPPEGFGVELNEGFLALTIPGHVADSDRERLLELGGEVATRIEAEIAEEGEISLDHFTEDDEIRDIERGIADVGYRQPPESVDAAVEIARTRTARKPITLLRGLWWGVLAAGVAAVVAVVFNPVAGALAALVLVPFCAYLGWLIGQGKYRWGRASVARVGLEAWTRGYAESRGFEIEDRWRFHATHKSLPVPGFADHVLAGELPGSDLNARLLFLGDAAELRAMGQEMAITTDRPLAASAILVSAGRDLPASAAEIELPEEYRIELDGSDVLVWRPIIGNMARTSTGTDRFCERAAELAGRVLSGASQHSG